MMLSFSDHLTIHKYALGFLFANANVKRHFNTSFFYGKKRSFQMFVNGLMVSPNPLNIYYFFSIVKQARIFTAKSTDRLEDYVSFSRAKFHPLVRSWCDWCSIVNGYGIFLVNAVNQYYEKHPEDSIEKKNVAKLIFLIKHLSYVKLMLVKDPGLSDERYAVPSDLFPAIYHESSPLKAFLEIATKTYNTFLDIEHQWCPFEHMKRVAVVANSTKDRYEGYLKCEGFDDIIRAGEVIYNFKHIKCHQCVERMNDFFENDPITSGYKLHGPTEDFFNLVCRLSR